MPPFKRAEPLRKEAKNCNCNCRPPAGIQKRNGNGNGLGGLIRNKLKRACGGSIFGRQILNLCSYVGGAYFRYAKRVPCKGAFAEGAGFKTDAIERKLREKLENERVPVLGTFIQSPSKHSPQHYAGYLWNYRTQAAKKSDYFIQVIGCILRCMGTRDVLIIGNLILARYLPLFPKLDAAGSSEDVKKCLLSRLASKKCVFVLKMAIRHWFLVMPILEEMQKHVDWTFISEIRAYLLDPDVLYGILVNVVYNPNFNSNAKGGREEL